MSDDYTVSVTINGTAATPNADGSYDIPNDRDSNISIVYTPATQSTIKLKSVEGVNTTTVGGDTADANGNIVVNYKNPGNIVVTPTEGYAITGIKLVNDADGREVALASPTFSNHIATVAGVPALTKDGNYTLTVETVKAGVKGIDGAEAGIIGRDKNSYDAIVFAAAAFMTPPRGQIHESMLYLIAQFLLLTTSIFGVSSIVSNRQWRDDYRQKI